MSRLSKRERAKGIIKSSPEDFVVEEITEKGFVLEKDRKYNPEDVGLQNEEGKFTIFIMQKKDWNTSQALKTIAGKFRRGVKSSSFAGTKDKTSVSVQLCSMFGVWPADLNSIHIKDISINGAWEGKNKIKMGELLGNKFGIMVREVKGKENIPNIINELNGVFPNYFGEQRFGIRKTNFDIGIDMLKGNFEAAAMNFLTETQFETNEGAKEAREKLKAEMDFKAALDYFPPYLKYERPMLEYLAKYPTNYANAIRKLPRSISLMFIHAVEAQIFNTQLDTRIESGDTLPRESDLVCYENAYGFPDLSKVERFDLNHARRAFLVGNIIGYDTKELTEFEKKALDDLGLTLESFKVNGLNELQSKGTSRALFAPFKDYVYSDEEESVGLNFSLPAGSYATVFLNEIFEN